MTEGEDGSRVVRMRPQHACPICRVRSVAEHYPFCSRRCAERDLHRWLTGGYSIPAADEDAPREDEGET